MPIESLVEREFREKTAEAIFRKIHREPHKLDTLIDTTFPEFKNKSFQAWHTFLSAAFNEDVGDFDQELYERCTGRTVRPENAKELWAIVGRRGGKSRLSALIAIYLAIFQKYEMAAGEIPVVMVVAEDKKQARVVMQYISGIIESAEIYSTPLSAVVQRELKTVIDLWNGVTIEVHAGDPRAIRGHTIVAAVCDEIAFWHTDERKTRPDTEILRAIRPGMLSVPNSLLVCISSPYARRGEMWKTYKKHWGVDDSRILVWKADTLTMNPKADSQEIEEAYEDDPANAAAEYGAEFRSDIEAFINIEAVEAVTTPGLTECPPLTGIQYFGFTDPSGGGNDSYTLAIAHKVPGLDELDTFVLDAIREKRPPNISLEGSTAEFADLLDSYNIKSVTGDRYAGDWPREQYRKRGIAYHISTRSRSEIYRDLLPLINAKRVELLDIPRLQAQLVGLERRTARGGRDSIDHAPRAHDDVANAAAGALVEMQSARRGRSKGAVWGAEYQRVG